MRISCYTYVESKESIMFTIFLLAMWESLHLWSLGYRNYIFYGFHNLYYTFIIIVITCLIIRFTVSSLWVSFISLSNGLIPCKSDGHSLLFSLSTPLLTGPLRVPSGGDEGRGCEVRLTGDWKEPRPSLTGSNYIIYASSPCPPIGRGCNCYSKDPWGTKDMIGNESCLIATDSHPSSASDPRLIRYARPLIRCSRKIGGIWREC